MTITLYVVHVYQRGRYVRTLEDPMDRRKAHIRAKTFNAKQAYQFCDRDPDRRVADWPSYAVVEAVLVQVNPPAEMPAVDPLGPGIRPTRRNPAVV